MTLDTSTFAARNISAAQLITTSDGTDALTITVPGPVDSAPLFAPFQEVSLVEDGEVRFIGWADKAPRNASGSSQSRTYELSGPMRWLDLVFFTQPGRGGRVQVAYTEDASVALGSLGKTLKRILDAVPQIEYNQSDLDIPALAHPTPPEYRLDSKCGELVRRVLKYAPTVIFWWEGRKIRFADAATTGVSRTLSESDDSGEDGPVYNLVSASLNPRFDLLYNKVEVHWLQDNLLARKDTATATAGDAVTLGAARTLVCTFEVGLYNVPAAGIAAALLKFHSRLHVESEAVLMDINWNHRVGEVWSYSGLFASTYKSTCWRVTRDLFRRTQSVSLGVPPSFGVYRLSEGNSGASGNNPRVEEQNGHAFQGIDVSDPAATGHKVRVVRGMINGVAPSGFSVGDWPRYVLDAAGSKVVYVTVTIDGSTGEITSRTLGFAGTLPADGDTTFNLEIFSYTVDETGRFRISQSVKGSLAAVVCRNWFAGSAPYYGLTWASA